VVLLPFSYWFFNGAKKSSFVFLVLVDNRDHSLNKLILFAGFVDGKGRSRGGVVHLTHFNLV
jgi:hypothetical protein